MINATEEPTMVLPPPSPARKQKQPEHSQRDVQTTAIPQPVNLGTSIASLVLPVTIDLSATPVMGRAGRSPSKRLATKKSPPKLPHERDESVNTTGRIASEPMKQAFSDLAKGLQDTDRAAEAGRTYKRLKQKK